MHFRSCWTFKNLNFWPHAHVVCFLLHFCTIYAISSTWFWVGPVWFSALQMPCSTLLPPAHCYQWRHCLSLPSFLGNEVSFNLQPKECSGQSWYGSYATALIAKHTFSPQYSSLAEEEQTLTLHPLSLTRLSSAFRILRVSGESLATRDHAFRVRVCSPRGSLASQTHWLARPTARLHALPIDIFLPPHPHSKVCEGCGLRKGFSRSSTVKLCVGSFVLVVFFLTAEPCTGKPLAPLNSMLIVQFSQGF